MGARKRYPWLTAEDLAILEQLPPEQAREFEAFLHRQARADARERQHAPEEAADAALPQAAASRWATGGGRRRRPPPRTE